MQSTVSERGQTVVPREIRRAFNIGANTRLEWVVRDGMIIVYPVPLDPIRGSRGILRGSGLSNAVLLKERRAERKRERALEAR